jgi:glucosamine-6-phosphate deaminase
MFTTASQEARSYTQKKNMRYSIYPDRASLGVAAAKAMAGAVGRLLREQSEVNVVFAAAPSQNEFLEALKAREVDWTRINAFHMDEYTGLGAGSTHSFAHYLDEHFFDTAPFKAVHYLNGDAPDLGAECTRYAALLQRFPVDVVCMGIGENNHIAFNDPPVADFSDPDLVKVVTLDPDCRRQQVNDGCFGSLGEVPTRALTLTIPALLASRFIFCMVPGERKATAVFHTLRGSVTEQYPSTILQRHPSVELFLDAESSKLIA